MLKAAQQHKGRNGGNARVDEKNCKRENCSFFSCRTTSPGKGHRPNTEQGFYSAGEQFTALHRSSLILYQYRLVLQSYAPLPVNGESYELHFHESYDFLKNEKMLGEGVGTLRM